MTAASADSDNAKRRLLSSLQKRNTTAFVGALAKFETYFGHLWGHKKHPDELSPAELQWKERWELCRTEVLNNGNAQTRAIQAEVLLYKVEEQV